jgi:Zn-dependent M28 family amino/carboxypeptidase
VKERNMKRCLYAVLAIAAISLLAASGFACRVAGGAGAASPAVSQTPNPDPSVEPSISPSPKAALSEIVAGVSTTGLYQLVAGLSGETPITVGGTPVTLTTRNTNSGTQISNAERFAYETLSSYGLSASYFNWTKSGYTNKNVIAEKSGSAHPDHVIIICANIDDMPSSGAAPGADTNASGCAGVFECARVLSGYSFEKTVRFIIFSGHEQGLYGSQAYVESLGSAETIDGVLDLYMIGYDDIGPATMRVHTRTASNPGYASDKALADAFVAADAECGLSIEPIIDADGESASDHSPFWQGGIPAALIIEDDVNDFNGYYHTTSDRLSYFKMNYFVDMVKAVTGTAASLAIVY